MHNPPYGLLNKKQNQKSSIQVTDKEINYYKTFPLYAPAKGGMLNIYRLFICQSHHLLKANGHMSLIFPMAFMCDLSAAELRKFVFAQESIQYLEAFPERDDENKRVYSLAGFAYQIKVFIYYLTQLQDNYTLGFETYDDVALQRTDNSLYRDI